MLLVFTPVYSERGAVLIEDIKDQGDKLHAVHTHKKHDKLIPVNPMDEVQSEYNDATDTHKNIIDQEGHRSPEKRIGIGC
jgi:predicted esterase